MHGGRPCPRLAVVVHLVVEQVSELVQKPQGDAVAEAMLAIVQEAADDPEVLRAAPHGRPVRRLDEVKAAKRAVVKYGFEEHPDLSGELAEPRQLEAQKGA